MLDHDCVVEIVFQIFHHFVKRLPGASVRPERRVPWHLQPVFRHSSCGMLPSYTSIGKYSRTLLLLLIFFQVWAGTFLRVIQPSSNLLFSSNQWEPDVVIPPLEASGRREEFQLTWVIKTKNEHIYCLVTMNFLVVIALFSIHWTRVGTHVYSDLFKSSFLFLLGLKLALFFFLGVLSF